MKVDWKQVASSPGYKSLKAAYAKDVGGDGRNWSGRSKEEMYARFSWVIARAQHYAARQNRSVSEVLNEWEESRQSWWYGHYSETSIPKLGSGKVRNVEPMTLRTYYKTDHWLRRKPEKERFHAIKKDLTREAKFKREHRNGKKPRWSLDRKRIRAAAKKRSL